MTHFLFSLEHTINHRLLAAPRRWLNGLTQAWLRWLVILALALAVVAVPWVVPSSRWLLLGVAAFALVTAIVTMRWPPVGLILLVVIGLAVPSPQLPGGLNVAVIFAGLLCGLWLVSLMLSRDVHLVPSKTIKPLLVFIGVSVLAFFTGQIPWFGSAQAAPLDTQLGALSIFVLSAGIFLVVAHQVTDLRWLEALTWIFLALATVHILGWLAPNVIGPIGSKLQKGATSNSMFWLWTVALALSQALFNRKLAMPWRLALGALALIALFVTYTRISDWKSGYLPIMIVIIALVTVRSWRLGLLLILLSLVPLRMVIANAISSDEYSYLTRIDAWLVVLNMVKISPVFGFGPANYHWYTELFKIRGYNIRFNSHNQYVDIIAQIGLLGLACFGWFVWRLARMGWELAPRAPEGFARAYVYGALAGLAGMLAAGMLVDWFLPFVYNVGLVGFRGSLLAWLFLGGLVSVEQITRRKAEEPLPRPLP